MRGANKIDTNKSPLKYEQDLWDQWMKSKDSKTADKLIQNYMYLVNFHVNRIASNLPSNVNKDDLKSFAYMGLFDAINKFDPHRELKFDTYGSFRIRGSIIDGLRKEDWLPRSLREKTKQIEAATEELKQTYHREPTSEEIAIKLEITADEVETLIRDSLYANVLSIEGKSNEDSNDPTQGIGYAIVDDSAISPGENLVKQEVKEELLEGIKTLNENEQLVVSLFYHEELTMTEIGEVVGLTTSRISQIHKRAIFKLRNTLKQMQV